MFNHEELANHTAKSEKKVEGAFFKVHFRGRVETMWGKTKQELSDYLNKQRTRFSHIEPLH